MIQESQSRGDGYKAVYHYLDADYNIEVVKTTKDKTTIDGKEISSSTISLVNDKKSHKIVVNIKK